MRITLNNTKPSPIGGLFSVLWVITFFALSGGNAFSQSEKALLKSADRHHDFEEYKEAIPFYQQAIELNAENGETQFKLGKCLYFDGQKSKALIHLKKVVDIDEEVSNEFPYFYGKCLHYNLKFDQAIEQYEKALEVSFKPKDPEYSNIQLAIKQCEYGIGALDNPVEATIENIGDVVNSPYSDHSPVISADETVMMFTSRRPGNMGSAKDGSWHDEDVYLTEWAKGAWAKPVNMGKIINNSDHDATIGLSPDGQTLFTYKNPPGNGDLFESKLEGNIWGAPKSLGSPICSKSYETSLSISPDGKTYFFASDRPGGQGDLDIYLIEKNQDGTWGDPENLGEQINSKYSEDSPFIHPNGKSLYFSSNGPNTIGGFDIFKSDLDENGIWSEPVNIGYPINTPDDDIYFVLSASGLHGYYASAKEGGSGEKDIYRIIMPTPKRDPIVVADSSSDVVNEEKQEKPEPIPSLTLLKGVVTDALTGSPLETIIKVIDNGTGEIFSEISSNSASGKYLVSLPSGKNYGISISHGDYLFHSENFDVPLTSDFQEIEKNIELKQLKVGSKIILKNIFFDHDKATLRTESKTELDRVEKILRDYPNLVIEISAHTDNVGSEEYNQKLSERRANSVVDNLVTRGIKPVRFEAAGYGETQPISTNTTKEGKQENRRIEFKILKN